MEGGKAFAKGLLAGAVGILAKPVEGVQRGGLTGLLGGVAKVWVCPAVLLSFCAVALHGLLLLAELCPAMFSKSRSEHLLIRQHMSASSHCAMRCPTAPWPWNQRVLCDPCSTPHRAWWAPQPTL